MTKQALAFKKVEALRAKHPNLKIGQILAKAKVHGSAYYKAKRAQVVAAPKMKRKYTRLKGAELPATPAGSDRVVFVMGSADQVRALIGGVL